MLGKKEELGRGAFGEMYVHLQPAAKPCSTLPDDPLYLKSGASTQGGMVRDAPWRKLGGGML